MGGLIRGPGKNWSPDKDLSRGPFKSEASEEGLAESGRTIGTSLSVQFLSNRANDKWSSTLLSGSLLSQCGPRQRYVPVNTMYRDTGAVGVQLAT